MRTLVYQNHSTMQEKNIPEIDVLVVGPPKSGKTVLLSSLYNGMSGVKKDTGFFLSAEDHQKGNVLLNRYANIEGTRKFPLPTYDIVVYTFFGKIKARSGRTFDALKINYYDYAGGMANLGSYQGSNEYQEILKKADVRIGLIDGNKLLRSLKNANYSQQFYLEEIHWLINDLTNLYTPNSGAAVHLIISKWDELRHYGFTILDVKQHLLKYKRFKEAVDVVIDFKGNVRLIPVSALGFDFMEYNEVELDSTPKELGVLEPYYVEIALSLALVDPLANTLKLLQNEINSVKDEIDRPIGVSPRLSLWQRIQRGIGNFAEKLSRRFKVDSEFLERVTQWKSIGDDQIEAAKIEEEKIRQELKKKLEFVDSEEKAANVVRDIFIANALKLKQDHPGSLIDKNN